MQWFQVTCPTCTAQLQVRLPEGITSVQCSQCKAVFAVQIQPTALDSTQPPGSKRSRKRKVGGDKDPNAVPRALSAYNVFMKQEVAKVKAQHVEMAHRDAFKMARPHGGRSRERWGGSLDAWAAACATQGCAATFVRVTGPQSRKRTTGQRSSSSAVAPPTVGSGWLSIRWRSGPAAPSPSGGPTCAGSEPGPFPPPGGGAVAGLGHEPAAQPGQASRAGPELGSGRSSAAPLPPPSRFSVASPPLLRRFSGGACGGSGPLGSPG